MDTEKSVRIWQRRIFVLLWTSYASYYLCRMNFAVAQPEILREFSDWTKAQIGLIPSVYSIFYATGQFLNGQIGSRVGARKMMVTGLSLISLINILYSSTSNFFLMLLLWAINGYCQSIGWPLLVQTMSSWFRVSNRGTMMGLISTSYQGGNVLAWLLAGYLVGEYGWRSAFWVPGLILVPVSFLLAVGLRDRPEDKGLPHLRDDEGIVEISPKKTPADEEKLSIAQIIKITLSQRTLWILALSYFCFNAVRYAFMNWTVQYFSEFHHKDIKESAFRAIVFPLIGSLGAIFSGWVSDRFFSSRRAPVCAFMLLMLAIFCLLFAPLPAGQLHIATFLLAICGFMIYGPDAILTGAAAIDFSHPKAASAAAGFIMAMGNLGSALISGFGVGYILDRFSGDWAYVFYTLGIFSIVSAGMASLLWNAKPKLKS